MTMASKERKTSTGGTVLTLGQAAETASGSHRPQGRRWSGLWLSFVLCVLLPLGAASVYYAAIATDRYAARAGFAIRSMDAQTGIDGIGALTGLVSAGSTTSDSYMVLNYLDGRALLEALDEQLDLRGVYTNRNIDRLSRLSEGATIEDFLDYWKKRLHTQFDPRSGIIEIEVQSFTADHARDIAQAILTLTQTLVNDVSAQARRRAVRFARKDMDIQEERLRQALAKIRDFRSSEKLVDPAARAALESELTAGIEKRLIDVKARIAVLRQTLDENAPSLVALRRDADALAAQIIERRRAASGGARDKEKEESTSVRQVPQKIAHYEKLEVEREFAQKAYASAQASLEQARRDADRQQRYLAVYLRPQVAESAEYPRRIRDLFVIAFALVTIWGIGALVVYSVRDHLT